MEYVYAALLIHKLGGKVDEATLKRVVEAAGGRADDNKARALIAALEGIDIEKAIKEAAIPVVSAPVVGEVKKEEKKEEKKSEEAAAAGLGLLFA